MKQFIRKDYPLTAVELISVASHFKSNKASLAEVVAELAAVDRLPFQIIAESHRINAAFRAQGYQIPKDRKEVKSLVIDFFEKVALNS